jgi:hypothetical protein
MGYSFMIIFSPFSNNQGEVMNLDIDKKYKISNKEPKRAVVLEIYRSKNDSNKTFQRYETFQK